jgi:tRNA (mo5U34)-methyltransferase
MRELASARRPSSHDTLAGRIRALDPWFHNLSLNGIETAPQHFLGNFPEVFFRTFADALPSDLTGWSVLDVGCNAGFYCFEVKRRGARRVVGIEPDPRYLAQARLSAEVLGADVEFVQKDVYDVGTMGERFDLVLFLGVLYHLRHPLLALDLLRRFSVGRLLVFQSMLRGASDVAPIAPDYEISERAPFDDPGYPRLHFVEQRYAHDETNWWVPNRACAEAMLRSAGFEVLENPEREVYLCAPAGDAEDIVLPRAFQELRRA